MLTLFIEIVQPFIPNSLFWLAVIQMLNGVVMRFIVWLIESVRFRYQKIT